MKTYTLDLIALNINAEGMEVPPTSPIFMGHSDYSDLKNIKGQAKVKRNESTLEIELDMFTIRNQTKVERFLKKDLAEINVGVKITEMVDGKIQKCKLLSVSIVAK